MYKRLIWFKILQTHHSQRGMTLMESLVVAVMLSIMVVVTTPPLIMGMATRIQNRRAEAAVTLAQQEIERIRLLVDQGAYLNDILPPVGKTISGTPITNPNQITEVAPPTSILNNPPCADPPELPCSEPNSSQAWWTANEEFIVQTFRDEGVIQEIPHPKNKNGNYQQVVVFRMGVRVYSKVSKPQVGSLRKEPAPLYLSTSPSGESILEQEDGDVITAKQNQFPLAVIYTDFSRGDLIGSLERYHEFTE